jgi:hypothetical protein
VRNIAILVLVRLGGQRPVVRRRRGGQRCPSSSHEREPCPVRNISPSTVPFQVELGGFDLAAGADRVVPVLNARRHAQHAATTTVQSSAVIAPLWGRACILSHHRSSLAVPSFGRVHTAAVMTRARRFRSIPQAPLPLHHRWPLQRCPISNSSNRSVLHCRCTTDGRCNYCRRNRDCRQSHLHCRCTTDGRCNPAVTPHQKAIQRQSIPRFSRKSILVEKRGGSCERHRSTRCPADGRAYGVCAAPTHCVGAARCREVSWIDSAMSAASRKRHGLYTTDLSFLQRFFSFVRISIPHHTI